LGVLEAVGLVGEEEPDLRLAELLAQAAEGLVRDDDDGLGDAPAGDSAPLADGGDEFGAREGTVYC
jgi:hypothetical protein